MIQVDLFEGLDTTETKAPASKSEAEFVLDMMDMLIAPLVVHKSPWAQDIPDRLHEDAMISRMVAAIKGEKKATWAEVTAYLMPASLDGPLPYEWAEIYLYASAQYIRGCRPELADSVAFAPTDLDSYSMSLLEGLRRKIYEKRREIVKKQLKATEKQARTEKPVVDSLQGELPLAAG